MNLYELKQERATVTQSIRDMMDKYDGKEMDGADKETFGNLEAKFDELNASIMREEKQLERERTIGEVEPKEEKPSANKASELFNKALMGDKEDIKIYNDFVAYQLGVNSQAGYLSAPVEFREELIKELDADMIFRSLARNIGTIGAAQSLGFPQMTARATDAEWVRKSGCPAGITAS